MIYFILFAMHNWFTNVPPRKILTIPSDFHYVSTFELLGITAMSSVNLTSNFGLIPSPAKIMTKNLS